jgi:hypothetical protein
MSTFLESVIEAFADLVDRGLLSVESKVSDPQAFGNAVVVLAGESFRLRLVLDRGDTFAQVASRFDPEDWFPLQRVIRAVGVSSPPAEGLLTPAETAKLVYRHYNALETGLQLPRLECTKRTLTELECLATKRLKVRPTRAIK